MKDLAGASVSRAGYEQLNAMCVYGTALPKTFELWTEAIADATREAAAQGRDTTPIEIDVAEFEA